MSVGTTSTRTTAPTKMRRRRRLRLAAGSRRRSRRAAPRTRGDTRGASAAPGGSLTPGAERELRRSSIDGIPRLDRARDQQGHGTPVAERHAPPRSPSSHRGDDRLPCSCSRRDAALRLTGPARPLVCAEGMTLAPAHDRAPRGLASGEEGDYWPSRWWAALCQLRCSAHVGAPHPPPAIRATACAAQVMAAAPGHGWRGAAGWKSSIGFPEGSSSMIGRPPGPVTISVWKFTTVLGERSSGNGRFG